MLIADQILGYIKTVEDFVVNIIGQATYLIEQANGLIGSFL